MWNLYKQAMLFYRHGALWAPGIFGFPEEAIDYICNKLDNSKCHSLNTSNNFTVLHKSNKIENQYQLTPDSDDSGPTVNLIYFNPKSTTSCPLPPDIWVR